MAEKDPTHVPVGFIGLGTMGSALSSHLLGAGYEVIGYDVAEAALTTHEQRGGVAAGGCAEVARRAELVVTSLPSVPALEEVTASGELWAGPRPDEAPLVVLETSTLPVEAKRDAALLLGEHGIALLDCPLSGTGDQARHRDVVAYLSGDDEAAKARAAPVLRAMTRAYYDVGGFGNGTSMKIVANLLVAVHNVAAAEALVLAERAGLDLDIVLRAIGDGAGTSRMFEVRGPLMIAGDYANATMRTELFAKDIDIITGFAARSQAPTPLFDAASRLYDAALAQGRHDEDTACVHAVLRELEEGRAGRE